jgi:hypothetical protein
LDLRRAIAYYAAHGIPVERLITDNGSAYPSAIHPIACCTVGIRHLRTRPYRPQANGKAERFIRTLLAGWAYGAIYCSSSERNAALVGWLDWYNTRRPCFAFNSQHSRRSSSTWKTGFQCTPPASISTSVTAKEASHSASLLLLLA